ncbi:pfs domain-containing protein [Trichoderma gamsii]|uniref:Pfs domain-containing protein n=1 Tax=Trichoderma gamsii TaxID=398673 RepID=A0A2P4ZLD9_9HYPO|nr:pfs domain-containing protein [Trichoderma gamsii]PON25117.1 pfs domain-containing protein [Trichoderma gamsii]
MATGKRTYDDYTIGWVATIPFGVAAFRALLDEEHESLPPQDDLDGNSYVLGRMGAHNVVLAFPGESKSTLAAEIVSNMAYSFPKIQLRLIVGVGGGAPQPEPDPKEDIRLGDVVVGFPNEENNCVVQWEKSTGEEGSFVAKCHLNGPPPVFIEAIKALKLVHAAENGNMQRYIDEAIQSNSPGMETIKYPGLEKDRLFKSGYMHKTLEPKSANSCAACNKEKIIERTPREPSHVMVHYGQIASSNKVMKASKKRDSLRKEWGVLCFEMEAANLTNDLPFLLIRGICDYSDSHKDNEWRPFASLTAAAYAKDLLMVLPSQEDGVMPPAAGSAGEESQVGRGLGEEEVSESNRGSETEREAETERDSGSGMSGMSGESSSEGERKAREESNTTDAGIKADVAPSSGREKSVEEPEAARGSKALKKSKMLDTTGTTKENKADKSEIPGDVGLGGESKTEGGSQTANNAGPQIGSGPLKKSKSKKGGTGKKPGSVRVQEAGQETGSATESLAPPKAPPKEPGAKKKAGTKSKGASRVTREDGTLAKVGTKKKARDSSSAVTTGGEAIEAMTIEKIAEEIEAMTIEKTEEAMDAMTVEMAGETEAMTIGKAEEMMEAMTIGKAGEMMEAMTIGKIGEAMIDSPAKGEALVGRLEPKQEPKPGGYETKTASNIKQRAAISRGSEAPRKASLARAQAQPRLHEYRARCWTLATILPGPQYSSTTDLSAAVRSGNLWLLRMILHTGVDPNKAEQPGGQSALHEAAYWNHPNAAKIIMGFMGTCTIHAKNHEGLTAIDVARKRGSEDVVRLLEAYM